MIGGAWWRRMMGNELVDVDSSFFINESLHREIYKKVNIFL